MQIINELINFFGLNLLESCETFPQFLQVLCYSFMACCLVLYIIRALCAMSAQVSNRMR